MRFLSSLTFILSYLSATGFQSVRAQETLGLSPDETVDQLSAIEIRTGGDAVWCGIEPDGSDRDANNDTDKLYALDYLLNRSREESILPASNWEAHVLRMTEALSAQFPSLARSLNAYATLVMSADLTKSRIWWPADRLSELESQLKVDWLQDANLGSPEFLAKDLLLLPDQPSCYVDGEIKAEKLRTVQAVVRRQDRSSNRVVYLFDKRAFRRLDPLQQSILLIHEWLWDFFRS